MPSDWPSTASAQAHLDSAPFLVLEPTVWSTLLHRLLVDLGAPERFRETAHLFAVIRDDQPSWAFRPIQSGESFPITWHCSRALDNLTMDSETTANLVFSVRSSFSGAGF